ncbi:MAG: glycosyltransferase family 4 protein [Moorea sp. SIO2B7]|nr:glycosyltransferase family 4 protein [Moorena sp. SIO2B7]
MLKIIVDATPIRPKPSGIGVYAYNLIQSLSKLQNEENLQIDVLFQPSFKNWLRGNWNVTETIKDYSRLHLLPLPVTIVNLLAKLDPNPIINHFEKYLGNPDLVHGTDYTVYPCQKSRTVMTIHDLTFLKYPDYVNSIVRTYYSRVKQCLKWTDLIITFSQNSKQDIVDFFQIESERIFVTPQASRYHSEYLSNQSVDNLQKLVNYDFSKPYLLFVSTLEPRKNITCLIRTFNYLKQKHKIEHQLVLIGQKGWRYKSIFAAIEYSPWKKEIHYLSYLSDELVALFYAQADVFVYPSFYEGFGLPVLEAMTLGAPVVTSNTSSLPEVAGDAAILVDPNDYGQIADAILKVITDIQFRQEFIQKGKERAKLFSWDKTARETIKAYKFLF